MPVFVGFMVLALVLGLFSERLGAKETGLIVAAAVAVGVIFFFYPRAI